MNILWLGEAGCQSARQVGGKTANLSRLAADYLIPPGFCVTAAALASLAPIADGVTEPPPPTALPSALQDELAAAYRELGQRYGVASPAVAVRSSAIDEDGIAASFAGQHETLLNVAGIDAVAGGVLRCRASAHSPRAREYRRRQGLPVDDIRLAVLVQALVPAEVSAVAFSVNPVTGEAGEIVVNAVLGLGESLASGSVTPDAYTVQKTDLAITSRQIAEKRLMTLAVGAGASHVEVPAEKRQRPALADEQVAEIARLVLELEARTGWPVDVECAFRDGQLWLLQCRPVTTRATSATDGAPPVPSPTAVEWQVPEDAQLTWGWSKMAFPEPLTPLLQSYLPFHTQGWVRDSRAQGTVGETRIRFYHGYFYSVWQPAGLTTWAEADRKAMEAERACPERWHKELLPLLRADHERVRRLDLVPMPDGDLALVLQETLTAQIRHFEIHAHIASFSYSAAERLVKWYLERFPGAPETEPYRLVQGLGNTSVESGHRLWELSGLLPAEGTEAPRLGDWARLPTPFQEAWRAFLEEFGHRTHALADPASPTWQEDPTPVVRLVLSYAENEVLDPLIELKRLAAEREECTAQVRARLRPEERETFETLLACARANYPLTEDHNHWIDQQSPADLRLLCREFGRRMAARGTLDRPQDVAFLSLSELILWGFGLADPLRARVAGRKAEHEYNRSVTPPDYLGAPPQPQPWVDRYGGPAVPLESATGEIRGVGASAGTVSGRARVVRTLDEAQSLRSGEVLVCVATDANWTPLFGVAAALVTEMGGSLCHAAVIAREYRLPAVVGTHTATRVIRSGQLVEVDGRGGIVRLLSLE